MQSAMDAEQSYRPEMDKVIYDGLLAMDITVPSGPEWDQFRQNIIDAFQDPRFDHLDHLPADADINQVNPWSGKHIGVYATLCQLWLGHSKNIFSIIKKN